MTDATHPSLGDKIAAVRRSWGWLVGLGVLTIIAGMIALGNQMIGTLVSVLLIGWMMGLCGVAQIVHAFQVREWGSFALWLLAGLAYVVGAGLIIYNPVLGATVFTLFLGISLIATGVLRLIVGFGMRGAAGWGWIALAGFVTLLLGLIIAAGWPTDSVWVLGLFLGIDLVITGVALVALGLRLKPAG